MRTGRDAERKQSGAAGAVAPRPVVRRSLASRLVSRLGGFFSGRAARAWDDDQRSSSTAFDDPASTRLGRSLCMDANVHPGLSGFSLLIHGREAFIARLAL